MADDIVTRLRLRAAHATDDYLSYAAADEIERLRSLITDFGVAHNNRVNNIGGGVETWNALNKATAAILSLAEVILKEKEND